MVAGDVKLFRICIICYERETEQDKQTTEIEVSGK